MHSHAKVTQEMASPEALRDWCRAACHPRVEIRDLSSSFRDGLAFCAIIHRHRPDLIDFSSLSKDNVYQNNQLAFDVAETKLGIPAFLDPSDMVSTRTPDHLSVITYLFQYYHYFTQRSQAGRAGLQACSPPAPHSKLLHAAPPSKTDLPWGAEVGPPRRRPHTVCHLCFKPVHLVQRRVSGGKVYHRSCFRCKVCRSTLLAGCYTQGSDAESLICSHHLIEPTMENGPQCERQEGGLSLGGLTIAEEAQSRDGGVSGTVGMECAEEQKASGGAEEGERGEPSVKPPSPQPPPTRDKDAAGELGPAEPQETARVSGTVGMECAEEPKASGGEEEGESGEPMVKPPSPQPPPTGDKDPAGELDPAEPQKTARVSGTVGMECAEEQKASGVAEGGESGEPSVKPLSPQPPPTGDKDPAGELDPAEPQETARVSGTVEMGCAEEQKASGVAEGGESGEPSVKPLSPQPPPTRDKDPAGELDPAEPQETATSEEPSEPFEPSEPSEPPSHGAPLPEAASRPVPAPRRNFTPVPAPRIKTLHGMRSPTSGSPSRQSYSSPKTSPQPRPASSLGLTSPVKTTHPWLGIIHPGPWTQLPPAPAPVPLPRCKSVSNLQGPRYRPRVAAPNPFDEVLDEDAEMDAAASRPNHNETPTSSSRSGAASYAASEGRALPRSISVPAIKSACSQTSLVQLHLMEDSKSVTSFPIKVCKENPFDRQPALPKSRTFQESLTRRAPAPGHGFPLIKRKVQTDQHVFTEDLQLEMRRLDQQLEALEHRGIELERKLRDSKKDAEQERLLKDWFGLMHERHKMLRRDNELVYLTKQQKLEEKQADVEYELRCLFNKPESDWSPRDRARERQLMGGLVSIIEQRNQIISCLDLERQREQDEDRVWKDMKENKELHKEGLKELKKSKGKFRPIKVFKRLGHRADSAKESKAKKS